MHDNAVGIISPLQSNLLSLFSANKYTKDETMKIPNYKKLIKNLW